MTQIGTMGYNGHDKVVQVFLDHDVQVDVSDKVSNISCNLFKLCKHWYVHVLDIINVYTMEVKTVSMYCHCSAIVVIMVYQYNFKYFFIITMSYYYFYVGLIFLTLNYVLITQCMS